MFRSQVGRSSPLKYSQSIHDLSSHIPERDKWSSPGRKQGNNHSIDCNSVCFTNTTDPTNNYLRDSSATQVDLQLCHCYMKDFLKNTTPLSNVVLDASSACSLSQITSKPNKLQLDKTPMKYKSLPVSPVSEERHFSDFAASNSNSRKSFSYFVDFNSTEDDLKQLCNDIEEFSNRKCDDEGSFSSDSLEEEENKPKKSFVARRCVSNNEIYTYQLEKDEIPRSESFYLNQNIKNSQDSVLSDENILDSNRQSYCNSMESILSNESECKSAPLEVLFSSQRKTQYSELTNTYYESCTMCLSPMKHSQSVHEKSLKSVAVCSMKTSQTQTDLNFENPEEIVAKKKSASADFQRKLLKFEACIAQNVKKPEKGIKQRKAAKENVEINNTRNVSKEMYIPSLESKNKQYKSKFCNVLNNKPESNVEIFVESSNKNNGSFTLTNFNFDEKNTNCNKDIQTSSLDRHLFTKTLLNSERVCHKPPKAVRRHSSKTRRTKTSYEYVKKDEFYKKSNNLKNNVTKVTNAKTIEFSYKEKNIEKDSDMASNKGILNELYDSLDKQSSNTRMENDSLEINFNNEPSYADSLETKYSYKNVEKHFSNDEIHFALENMKILNEIQHKISRINDLVDIFKRNMCSGKVRALSSMYESLTSSRSCYNDFTKPPMKFRRRNLSLPCFVERRLNFETNEEERARKLWKKPNNSAEGD